MYLYRFTNFSNFRPTPRRFRQVGRLFQAFVPRRQRFAIAIGRHRPFRALRFVDRGHASNSARHRPKFFFLEERGTAIGRVLCLLRIFFRSLGIFFRLHFRHVYRPLMNFIRLVGLEGTGEGSFHEVLLPIFASLGTKCGLFHLVRVFSFQCNGQAFRDGVIGTYRPRVTNMVNAFFLGRLLTMNAFRVSRLRRKNQEIFFRFLASKVLSVVRATEYNDVFFVN